MKKRCISVILAVMLLLTMAAPMVTTAQAASTMTVSEDLIRVLKTMEGFRAIPYWDYGQWTVGYGTECPADKLEEYKKNGISEQAALELLAKELDRFETAVNGFIDKHGLSLQQHQFDALVSFSYNCGEAWMYETTGYFNTAVREQGAADELIYGICLYSTAGGEYILVDRRMCEANMYINGVYSAYNTAGNPDNLRHVFLDGNGGDVRYAIYGFDAKRESAVNVAFSRIPTGVDKDGKTFAYTLEGWYTEAGVKVEKLDSTIKEGQILYAKWADPEGVITDLPRGQLEEITVAVTGDSVNVRKGPGTYYGKVGSYDKQTAVPLTETYEIGGYTWGKSQLGWFRLDYTNYADLKAAQSQFPKDGTVTGDGVNVRKGPGTDYDRVGKKNKGDRVTITEETDGGSYRWGKMTDGNWICLDYVLYDEDAKAVSTVALVSQPYKTEYIQRNESLHLEGGVLLVTYTDGTSTALTPTRSMVTSYDNTKLGQTTAKITCEGKTVNLTVTIIKATVTFADWDGTVLASAQYAYGETVTPPATPEREGDGTYFYVFSGWDKEVKACTGNAVYTATYVQSTDPDAVVVPQSITSSVYTVSDGYIRKIPAGTKAETLVAGINESGYVTVCNGDTAVNGATPVSTGMTVKLAYNGNTIQTLTVVVTGDVNGDAGISITDALQIKSFLLQKSTLSEAAAVAADTNADGTVSITDFLQLKAKLLGKSEITPN